MRPDAGSPQRREADNLILNFLVHEPPRDPEKNEKWWQAVALIHTDDYLTALERGDADGADDALTDALWSATEAMRARRRRTA